MQRLRDAIVSEKLGSQTIETDTMFSQIESPANGQDNPRVDDIYYRDQGKRGLSS